MTIENCKFIWMNIDVQCIIIRHHCIKQCRHVCAYGHPEALDRMDVAGKSRFHVESVLT